VGFLAYLAVVARAPSLGRRVVWGAIVLLVAVFALVPPLVSHDVYSYVDYARLGATHGLDPYVHPPAAAPADPAFAHVDWTGATSVYGPLFTLGTYPLAWLPVGTAVLALKLLAAATTLALTALVARLAAVRGIDPLRAAAFVGLNPLVLVHVVGGPHNDGMAILLAMLGVAAVLAAEEFGGGVAFAAAVGVKATAVFAAPFALLGSRHRGRFLLGGLVALALLALVSWPAFGLHWLSALGGVERNLNRATHMSVPTQLAQLTGLDRDVARVGALYVYGGLVAFLLAWTWAGGDWVRAAGWAGVGLLLATTWLLPWYLIWALPLAALSRDRPLQLLVLAVTALQLGVRLS
jgi:alpha-1,6-mannosyltransferase